MKIQFPKLRQWQEEFFKNSKRFNVLVIHRRAWKTVVAILHLLTKALESKGFYGYIAPTYRQAKAIAWVILKTQWRKIQWSTYNESELTITLFNWSRIRLFGSDTPDSLRWLDLKWVVFDEYSQQPANIYWEIIFPMINANNGWVIWIWTPKWKNNFYQVYRKGREDNKYYTLLLQASSSWLLTTEQLNAAKDEMTDEEYQQEYECSFDAAIRWAYYNKEIQECRKAWRIKDGLYDPLLPVYTFWDIWISDYMAIIFVQIHWNSARIIDVHQENGKWFQHYAKLIRDKWFDYVTHYFPHDIEVRELTTWQSRLETVRDLFWVSKVQVLPKLKIMDWISAARNIFHNVWFDESKTELLVEALSLYRQKYDEKRDIFLQQPEHDWTSHFADSFRYFATGYNMVTKTVDTSPIEIDFSDLV